MIKTKIKVLMISLIFILLLIPTMCNAEEVLTYGNFNYHIETTTEWNGTESIEVKYVVLDSVIDKTVTELRVPAEIDSMEVRAFADEIYIEETNEYTHIINSCPNLVKVIFENADINFGYSSNSTNNTVTEIVIEQKEINPNYTIYSFRDKFTALEKISGYGETRLKLLAENLGYTYNNLGENTEHFCREDYNPSFGQCLNVNVENVVVKEDIYNVSFAYITSVGQGTSTEAFSKNIAQKIKTIRFETKKQLYVHDQKNLINVETVYGYTGTGAENVAQNIGAEFVSLGTVDEVNMFMYEIVEDTDHSYVKITGLNRITPYVIEFPDTIEGLPVEVIGGGAVAYRRYGSLVEQTGAIIPASVKKVELGAFSGMNMYTLKVLSKEIEYLDNMSMDYGSASGIQCMNIKVTAYKDSGMVEVLKKIFGEVDYASHYIELVDKFTNIETEDVTVDTESGDTVSVMPITSKTDVDSLLTEENFPVIGTYTVKVLDATKTVEKKDTDKVGSKNIIQIISTDALGNETVVQEYMVIVKGDINGDGEIKMYDSFQILKGSIMNTVVDAVETLIRDKNDDGKIMMYDAFQFLKQAILN